MSSDPKVELPDGIEYQQVEQIEVSSEIFRRFGVEGATELDIEFIEFAQFIDDELPSSREKSLALTALEEASMWAHKAANPRVEEKN